VFEDVITQSWILARRIFAGTFIFLAFWIAGSIAQTLIFKLSRGRPLNPDLLHLLGRTAKGALLVFGAVSALATAGLDVSALVAGLGLTGFALGFAFRDILSNFLAGVLILMYKPFRRGDRVSVAGLEGTVSNIDLRYTVLESEGKTVLIPNSILFTNPITVWQADR
jgi:small conductance mechanosensitive channel